MSRPWPASALLFLVALPLSAALQISPERVLAPPVQDRAIGTPLIASNGIGYLAAWSGPSTTFVEPIARDGTPLRDKPEPVDVPAPSGARALSDIASDGTDYVLITAASTQLESIAVDGSGNRIATTSVATSVANANQARLAWNGEKYLLIVYSTVSPSGAATGQFLNRRGIPIGDPFKVLDNLDAPRISVASNGQDFLVADFSYNNCLSPTGCNLGLFTVAVSASGAIGTMNRLGPTNDTYFVNHALRFAGHEYVLVWNDGLGDFRSVNEVPLDPSGQPLHPARVIATGDTRSGTTFVSAASTRDGVVALILDSNKVGAVRIDADGEPSDSPPIDVPDIPRPQGTDPSVEAAAAGDGVFAVWTQYETTSGAPVPFVYGNAIDFTKSQGGHSIVSAAIDDVLIDLAASGRTQLLLTMNLKPAQRGNTIYARRLVDGVPNGPAVAIIEPQLQTPITSIAANGDDFLVVSAEFDGDGTQPRTIRARLLRNGAAPANVLELGHGSDAPFAIWTGDHYLVLWTATDFVLQSGYRQRLMATRISGSGQLIDAAPRQIAAAPDFNTGYAKIVATPAGLVAIYLHGTAAFFRTVQGLSYDVYASRISADGEFLGRPVAITNTAESEILMNPAADAGGNILLTWVEIPLDYHYGQTSRGAVIGNDLLVRRRFDFSTAAPHAVAWSGSSFVVAWTADQVHAQRYSRDGDPTSVPVALTGDASSKGAPLLVSMPGGAFIAYTHVMPESSGSDAQRLVGRTIFDEVRRRAVTPR